MKIPRKYREDKIYLKLSETTKQKRWYEAAKYGDDNPLLVIGITERQMKDDYNEYTRNIRQRSKAPITPQKSRKIIQETECISERHSEIILQLRTGNEMKEEMVRNLRISLEDKDTTIENIRKDLAQEKREREVEMARDRQERISQDERLRREHSCEMERLRQEYSLEISHLKDKIANLTVDLS